MSEIETDMFCPSCGNDTFKIKEGWVDDYCYITLICTSCKKEEGVSALKFDGGVETSLVSKEEKTQ